MSRGVPFAWSLLVVAVAVAGVSSAAVAATYQVPACFDAPHGESSAFTSQNTSPQTITTSVECPPAPGVTFSGLLVSTTLGAPNSSDGASGSWGVTAPAGTTLSALSVRRYFGKRDELWNVAVKKADGTALETCDFNPGTQLECTVGSDTPTDVDNYVTYTNLDTQSVSFGIVCQAGAFTCLSGSSQRQAWIAVYAATATVDDPDPPAIGAPQGALVGMPSGWHRGIEQAIVPATDASGVKSVSLLIDGSPVAQAPQTCDYTHMQPCPGSVQPTLAADLGQLADGAHQLQFAATDAADQEKLTTSTPLRVDHHAPTAPLGLAVHRNADGTYAASWTNPDQGAAAPIAGVQYHVCDQAGIVCSANAFVAGSNVSSLASIPVPASPAHYVLDIWLEDAATNADPATAASAAIDTTGGGGSGGGGSGGGSGGGGGGGSPPPARRGAGLGVKKVTQHGSVLTLAGVIAPTARGTLTAVVRRAPTGRTTAAGRASVLRGAWRIHMRLPSRIKRQMRYLLVLTYAGDSAHVRTRLARTLVARHALVAASATRAFRVRALAGS